MSPQKADDEEPPKRRRQAKGKNPTKRRKGQDDLPVEEEEPTTKGSKETPAEEPAPIGPHPVSPFVSLTVPLIVSLVLPSFQILPDKAIISVKPRHLQPPKSPDVSAYVPTGRVQPAITRAHVNGLSCPMRLVSLFYSFSLSDLFNAFRRLWIPVGTAPQVLRISCVFPAMTLTRAVC